MRSAHYLGWTSPVIAAAISVAAPHGAHAAVISTLFDTGVAASGAVLPDGTIGDPHYSLVSVPGGTSTTLIRTSAGGYPIPPYLADDTLSAWIGPDNSPQVLGPAGNYDYQTSFTLTGFQSASASITGQWATDNGGVDILINGVSTGQSIPDNIGSFEAFHTFSINSGFVAGLNTIDFIVYNDPGNATDPTAEGPTALRVELTGSATPVGTGTGGTSIPEPSSLPVIGAGMLALATWRQRARS